MGRTLRIPAARHFKPGALRGVEAGTVLECLVLVPGHDWVAVDTATGALVRARSNPASDREASAADADVETLPLPGPCLSAVELVLGQDAEPPDPARPEAVVLARRPARLHNPRRRPTRRLLQHLVTKSVDRPLLGTLGPSVAYGDLAGSRPSVVLVAPERPPRFGAGPSGPWCQFSLSGRRHVLPMGEQGPPDQSVSGTPPKLLVIGLGVPRRGQVPKIVFGALPRI
jgi:hypothetical protein